MNSIYKAKSEKIHFWKKASGDRLSRIFFLHATSLEFFLMIAIVQSLSRVWPFVTPWTAALQASLSFTISQKLLKLTSIESVMPSNHMVLCRTFSSCLWSFPASGSFRTSVFFASGGQSIEASASASFLPKKSQGWSPSEWTGLISLQSKGLSRVFSNTTVQKHQFFGAQLSSQSNSHIQCTTTGKTIALTRWT